MEQSGEIACLTTHCRVLAVAEVRCTPWGVAEQSGEPLETRQVTQSLNDVVQIDAAAASGVKTEVPLQSLMDILGRH